jgi:outer membrane protein
VRTFHIRAVLLAGALCAVSSFGQQSFKMDEKESKVESPLAPTAAYFRHIFSPPEMSVDIKAPTHLRDDVVDGKLELSLKSYLELVLANNTDIEVQRVTVEISKDAITRGFAIFDPQFNGRFTTTRTQTPSIDALAGATRVNSLAQPSSFTYQQTLSSGATYNVGFSTLKTSTNSSFALFNPSMTANLVASFSQPLLRNRGSFMTKLPITVARAKLKVARYGFEAQVLQLVSNAENAYWDAIQARETVKVSEQALALADASLKRSKRELELGAISPLDIFQPEAQYANYQLTLSQARFALLRTEDILRKQMGADLDPEIRKLPIVLTETLQPPVDRLIDREAMVQKAIHLRPDVSQARQAIEADDLNIRGTKNLLKPNLALTGQYGTAGLGGPAFTRQNVFQGDGTTSSITTVIPGGFGDTLSQLFGFGFPVYGFGLTLNLPLRDRNAAANYADALVNKKLDALAVRQTEQQVRVDVLSSITDLENAKSTVELAKVALDFAQKRADAEQKKYDLGTSTLFFLLDAQTQLNQAQSALVNSSVSYKRATGTLLRFTGELLPERGITVQ